MSEKLNDRDINLSWQRAIGLCEFLDARFDTAISHMEQSKNISHATLDHDYLFAHGILPLVIANSISAWSHWFQGDETKANSSSKDAIDLARSVDQPYSEAYALCLAASVAQCQHRIEIALNYSEQALEIAEIQEFPYWKAWANLIKGWTLVQIDDAERGITILRKGITQYQAIGAGQMKGYAHCLLAESFLQVGQYSDALSVLKSARAEMQRSGIRFYEAAAIKLQGEILCSSGDTRYGLVYLQEAASSAAKIGATPILNSCEKSLRQWANCKSEA